MRLLVGASAGLLALGALYVVYRPAGGEAGIALKDFGKNCEIVVITLGVVAWVTGPRRFVLLYGLATAVFFTDLFAGVVRQHGEALDVPSLQTTAPLLLVVFLLPFVRRAEVLPLLGFGLAMLLVARTREAWVAAIVVAVVAFAVRPLRESLGHRIALGMGAGVVALLVMLAAVPPLRRRVEEIFTGDDQSIHDRIAMAHGAQLELQKHLLTGVGPGEFKHWLLAHPPPFDFWIGLEVIPLDPHNAVAKFAAEMGLPGMVLFLCWGAAVLGTLIVYARPGLELEGLRPYVTGVSLFGVCYALMLVTSEWGAITRVQLPLGAALLLSLARVVPAAGRAMSPPP
jgi:hypothetical protein